MKFYALDIETDTSKSPTSGLDPNEGGITSIAFVGDDLNVVLTDSHGETEMLGDLEKLILSVPAGVITSWNGAVFDFPFIASRSEHLGVKTSLRLLYDPSIEVKYRATPGFLGGYRVNWGTHSHLDVQHLYKAKALEAGVPWSLKPVGRLMGLDPIEVDRTKMHLLTPEEERAYVLSDAVTTLALSRLASGVPDIFF